MFSDSAPERTERKSNRFTASAASNKSPCPCKSLSPVVVQHRPNSKSSAAVFKSNPVSLVLSRVRLHNKCTQSGLAASVAEAGCSQGWGGMGPAEELSGGSSGDSEGLGEKSHGPVSVTRRRCRVDWGKPARYRQLAALLSVVQQEKKREREKIQNVCISFHVARHFLWPFDRCHRPVPVDCQLLSHL